jgi:hypothetical protein
MRKSDKIKNIKNANLILESVWLESKKGSSDKDIIKYIVGDDLTEDKNSFNNILQRVKDVSRKGLMTASILTVLLSPKFGFSQEQKDEIKKHANIESVQKQTKEFGDYIKMIKENPKEFYNKLTSDSSFSSTILESFSQKKDINWQSLEQFRVEYFINNSGGVMLSSQSPDSPKTLKKGIEIKTMDEYKESVNWIRGLIDGGKEITIVTSFLPQNETDQIVQKIVKFIFQKSN